MSLMSLMPLQGQPLLLLPIYLLHRTFKVNGRSSFRFGKISNSSMRILQDGSTCCDIKFEENSQTHHKTSDSVVHAICQSCGFSMKVERIDANALDIFFSVENKSDAKNILKRLNCTIMDDCNWSASLQSGDDDASTSSSDDEDNDDMSCNSGLKTGEKISELKRLYTMKKLHVEDLENLQEVILHIKSRNDDLKEQI